MKTEYSLTLYFLSLIVFCLKTDFIFLDLKITVDGDCSHNIKATASLVVVIQSLNCVQFFVTPWTAGCQLPCPSLSPEACSNLYLLSWCCHPTISCSVTSFSFCPQSFPSSGSFPVSQLISSCGQTIAASNSASEQFCIPGGTSVFLSSCDSVVGDSLEFNQANRGSLRV